MLKNNIRIIFFLIVIFGFIFKLWFSSLYPQPFVFDQKEYYDISQNISKNFGYVNSTRTYGYPLFLSFVFLFGKELTNLYLAQALLDTTTGIVLFIISLTIFKSKKVAFLVLIIQSLNPFTAAYVRVVLTEILSMFLVSLSLLFFILINKKRLALLFALLFGLTAGFLTQTRPAFLYWTLLTPFLFIISKKPQIKLFFIIYIGIFISSFYQLYGNLKTYDELVITSVDRYLGRELYNGAIIKETPLTLGNTIPYPKETILMYADYMQTKTPSERKDVSDKYVKKTLEIIQKVILLQEFKKQLPCGLNTISFSTKNQI